MMQYELDIMMQYYQVSSETNSIGRVGFCIWSLPRRLASNRRCQDNDDDVDEEDVDIAPMRRTIWTLDKDVYENDGYGGSENENENIARDTTDPVY